MIKGNLFDGKYAQSEMINTTAFTINPPIPVSEFLKVTNDSALELDRNFFAIITTKCEMIPENISAIIYLAYIYNLRRNYGPDKTLAKLKEISQSYSNKNSSTSLKDKDWIEAVGKALEIFHNQVNNKKDLSSFFDFSWRPPASSKPDIPNSQTSPDKQTIITGSKNLMKDACENAKRVFDPNTHNEGFSFKKSLYHTPDKIKELLLNYSFALKLRINLYINAGARINVERINNEQEFRNSIDLFFDEQLHILIKPNKFGQPRIEFEKKMSASPSTNKRKFGQHVDHADPYKSVMISKVGLSSIKSNSSIKNSVPFSKVIFKSMQLIKEIYGFITKLIEKTATFQDIQNLNKIASEFIDKNITSYERNDFNAIQISISINEFSNENLIKKSILNPKPIEIKQNETCRKCGNKNIPIVTSVSGCPCPLSHCFYCMTTEKSKQGILLCPICKKNELSPEALQMLQLSECIYCKKGMVTLPCGENAHIICLQKYMKSMQKENANYSKMVCEKHNKQISEDVLSKADPEISSNMGLSLYVDNILSNQK